MVDAREAAFLALLSAHRQQGFLIDFLESWSREERPSERDFRLAQEISYGTERRLLSLDYLAHPLMAQGKLHLKLKEKLLLRMGFYQYFFMERIPPHALVHEMVALSLRYCHRRFANFLNAVLRRLPSITGALPCGDTADEISICYSYPLRFVQMLLEEYGLMETKEILAVLNKPPIVMARVRPHDEMIVVQDVSSVAADPRYYIQNATPVQLIKQAAGGGFSPKTILDLCAAPGGKLLFLHDLFPDTGLWANDPSEERLVKLRANLDKYRIEAELSCCPAEGFPLGTTFDLILLDVPCSNSGVLHKRPEARWRLSKESLEQLTQLQWAILKRASQLLTPCGKIWYMTCSILKEENEGLMARACAELDLVSTEPFHKQLPDRSGMDGGFACALTKRF